MDLQALPPFEISPGRRPCLEDSKAGAQGRIAYCSSQAFQK